MTSIATVLVPASGTSARASAAGLEGGRSRAVEASVAAGDRRGGASRDDFVERELPGLRTPLLDLDLGRPADTPQAAMLPQLASQAYRTAGAEPPYYGGEARLVSVRA